MAIDYGDPSLSPIIPSEIPSSQRVETLKAKRQYEEMIKKQEAKKDSYREIKKAYGEAAYGKEEQIYQMRQLEKLKALQEAQKRASKTTQQVSFTQRQQAYAKTRTGRFGAGLQKIGSLFSMSGLRNWSYGGQIAPKAIQPRIGKGRAGPGRPRGTKDPRYAAYGGVYGWRKAMAQQRALERIKAAQQANLSPEQQQIVQRVAMEQQAQRFNPERQIIPDTRGDVPLKRIQDDIDAATHLFD